MTAPLLGDIVEPAAVGAADLEAVEAVFETGLAAPFGAASAATGLVWDFAPDFAGCFVIGWGAERAMGLAAAFLGAFAECFAGALAAFFLLGAGFLATDPPCHKGVFGFWTVFEGELFAGKGRGKCAPGNS